MAQRESHRSPCTHAKIESLPQTAYRDARRICSLVIAATLTGADENVFDYRRRRRNAGSGGISSTRRWLPVYIQCPTEGVISVRAPIPHYMKDRNGGHPTKCDKTEAEAHSFSLVMKDTTHWQTASSPPLCVHHSSGVRGWLLKQRFRAFHMQAADWWGCRGAASCLSGCCKITHRFHAIGETSAGLGPTAHCGTSVAARCHWEGQEFPYRYQPIKQRAAFPSRLPLVRCMPELSRRPA